MDEAKAEAEGHFERIDDEEEPRARPDDLELREGHGERIQREDRAGGIGKHRRDPGDESHAPREPAVVRHAGEPVRTLHPRELQQRQAQDDPAGDRSEHRVVDITHQPRPDDDADARRREHAANVVPPRVLMEHGDRADIANEEHRQHDSRGVPGAEQEREDGDVEQAESREAAFADPHRGGRDKREGPLQGRQVRHARRVRR